MIGRSAAAIASAAARSCRGCTLRGGFQPGRSTSSGYSNESSASCTSFATSIRTGPWRPVRATWNAAFMHRRQLLHVLHEPRVLDDRHRDPGDVDLLKGVGADQVRPHLPGDEDRRRRVHPRVGDRRHEVRRSGPGRRDRHPDLPRRTGVPLGHVPRALLVSGEDVSDRRAARNRVVGWEDRAARNPEGDVHALVLERAQDGVRAEHAGT